MFKTDKPVYITPSLSNANFANVGTASSTVWDALVANGNIRARGFVVDTAADLAETFPAEGGKAIPFGTLVSFSTSSVLWNTVNGSDTSKAGGETFNISPVRPAQTGEDVVGVVSSNPGMLLGGREGTPIAFSGRIPVLVTSENGPIKKGDYIILSEVQAGYGAKLNTNEGKAVGRALSDDNGTGKVLMLVENKYVKITAMSKNALRKFLSATSTEGQGSAAGELASSTLRKGNVGIDLEGQALINVKSIISASGNWSIDENGLITAKEIKTNKLCVGTRCVTQAEFESVFGVGPIEAPTETTPPTDTTSTSTGTTTETTGEGSSTASSSPSITINGLSPVTVASTTSYVDAGATAVDWSGASVSVSDDVASIDFSVPGTYTIHYTATDANGSGSATRQVTVE